MLINEIRVSVFQIIFIIKLDKKIKMIVENIIKKIVLGRIYNKFKVSFVIECPIVKPAKPKAKFLKNFGKKSLIFKRPEKNMKTIEPIN